MVDKCIMGTGRPIFRFMGLHIAYLHIGLHDALVPYTSVDLSTTKTQTDGSTRKLDIIGTGRSIFWLVNLHICRPVNLNIGSRICSHNALVPYTSATCQPPKLKLVEV